VWQGSAGDRRPYADQTALPDARRAPCLSSLLTENAHPVKH
jgi:hypothetical protein